MTDLTPNDLSHLSEESFIALCPQGEHAPGAEPLSPAARAIVDAFNDRYELCGPLEDNWHEVSLAAALRAAALYCERDRLILLSLADELEGYELQ